MKAKIFQFEKPQYEEASCSPVVSKQTEALFRTRVLRSTDTACTFPVPRAAMRWDFGASTKRLLCLPGVHMTLTFNFYSVT